MRFIAKLDSSPGSNLSLALYKNVENTAEIRKLLVEGKLECSILKPELVIDPFQVVVATNKAVHKQKIGKLITKTVFSEIVYNMSASKNITDSLKKFGVGVSDRNLLLVILDDENDEKLQTISQCIQGTQVDLSQLLEFTDEMLIKKYYKLKEPELLTSSLLDSVVSRISTKDFVSY